MSHKLNLNSIMQIEMISMNISSNSSCYTIVQNQLPKYVLSNINKHSH